MNNSKHRIKDFLSKRNISIFILFVIIIGASIGLTIYNLQLVEKYTNDGSEITIEIYGNVKREVNITLTQLKSDYQQVINQKFYFINDFGNTWSDNYSGAVIWDIFNKEDCLNPNSTRFRFEASDLYTSRNILFSLVEQNPELVLLAYERNGIAMGGEPDKGPIEGIVNRSLFPDWNTIYTAKHVVAIRVY